MFQSCIAACRKIRNIAKLDRVRLDETEHRSGLNKHLFEYIEYCKRDVLDFIKEYLCNLQPYMLERRKDQEAKNSFICVIDKLYRISVYIKVDSTQFEELIVSFHEDKNSVLKVDQRKFVPVFADCILSQCGDNYVVKVFVQRGLKIFPLDMPAKKCKDVFRG